MIDKLQWINRERLYWANRFDVPMSQAIPEGFPTSTTDIQTALGLISRDFPDQLLAMSQKFYHIFWADGDTTIAKPENFLSVIKREMGEDAANQIQNSVRLIRELKRNGNNLLTLNQLSTLDAKELLLKKTEEVFDSGAFGLPWFQCVNAEGAKEGFWGIDHLGRVVDFLQLDASHDRAFRVLL